MLGISGPGYATLEAMGLLPSLRVLAHTIGDKVFLDRHGREVYRSHFGQTMARTDFMLLNRVDLTTTLYEAQGEHTDVRFGATVETADVDGPAARVTLSSGETIEADLFVGADGVRSQMRERLFGPGAGHHRPLGYRFAAYEVEDLLGLRDGAVFHTAPAHFAESYPLPNGRLAALQVWPSQETGLVPAGERWRLLRAVAKGAHADVFKVIAAAEGGPAPILDDLLLVEAPCWSKGRGVLIGDAAHCLTFISGQGAGISIASAGVLAEALSGLTVPEGLAEHERRLRPAIHRLQAYSRRRAKGMIPGHPLSYGLRMMLMRHVLRRTGRPVSNVLEAERLAAMSILPAAS